MPPSHPAEDSDRDEPDDAPAPMDGAQFRAVIDNLAQGLIVMDPVSQILYWNRAARAMHGFVSSEAAKRTLQALPSVFEVSTLEGTVLEPDDWPLARLLRGESIDHVKLRVRRWESDWSRVFQYSGAQVACAGDGKWVAFLVMEDVTRRRIAEEAQMRLAAIVNSSSDAIIGTTMNGLISDWNSGAEALLGHSAAEMVGRPIAALASGAAHSEEAEVFRKIEPGPLVRRFEAALVRKDGRRIGVCITVSPIIDADEKIIGQSLIVQDIDHRKRHERELERRVIERTGQLEMAIKDLEAFSYSVSHDLRAPLRTVNGFAEIILADFGAVLPEEAQRLLKRIRSRGLYMGVLIDDLLEFSRLGRRPINRREVDMRSLAEDAFRGLAPETEGRRIEFNLGELPRARGDPVLLLQVWVNLLSNAIKYSRGRDPAVIDIGSVIENGGPVYFVRDNGIGFDMQFAHKLFDVFQRLHLAEEFEGTGVGLAIVRRIVERHGGL